MEWNCRAISNKLDNLKTIADEYDIIMLSETWLHTEKTLNIKNFNAIRNERPLKNANKKDHGGGVCILIKSNLPYQQFNQIYHEPYHFESVAILLQLENPENKLLICSVYRPPGKTVLVEEWNKYLQSTDQFESKIIGGDFNTHNALSGSSHNCPSGCNLVEALQNRDLVVLNDGSMTYIKTSDNSEPSLSAIDLTLASPNIALQTI